MSTRKLGMKFVLNRRLLLVNEKANRTKEKTAFKTLQQFLAVL